MTLDSLLIFAKTVEANSFSEAARRLNMPVSTVSRRIAELEAQLGVRLLERSTRSLRITDIGSEVLEHAQRSAEHCTAVEEIVASQSSTLKGILRLAAPPSITGSLVSPLAVAFQLLNPEVRIHVLTTDSALDHVDEGIDLSFRLGPCKDSSLITRSILRCAHRLFASPAYLERHGVPTHPRDLSGHRLLALASSMQEEKWSFMQANGEHEETIAFLPRLAINDLRALMSAISAGAGIGRLPCVSLRDDSAAAELVPVLANRSLPGLDVSVARLANPQMRRIVRAFTDFAVQAARAMFVEPAERADGAADAAGVAAALASGSTETATFLPPAARAATGRQAGLSSAPSPRRRVGRN